MRGGRRGMKGEKGERGEIVREGGEGEREGRVRGGE